MSPSIERAMTRSLFLLTASFRLVTAFSVSPLWYARTPCTYELRAASFRAPLDVPLAQPLAIYNSDEHSHAKAANVKRLRMVVELLVLLRMMVVLVGLSRIYG